MGLLSFEFMIQNGFAISILRHNGWNCSIAAQFYKCQYNSPIFQPNSIQIALMRFFVVAVEDATALC